MRLSAKIGAWLALLVALIAGAMVLMFRAGSSYTPEPNVPGAPGHGPAVPPPAKNPPPGPPPPPPSPY